MRKTFFIGAIALLMSFLANAVEPTVCILLVGTGGATTTLDAGVAYDGGYFDAGSPIDGGAYYNIYTDGGVCNWPKGGTVTMQCVTSNGTTGIDVYADSTTVGSTRPSADTIDQLIQFTANSDPYIWYLGPNDQEISVLGVNSGYCKFMTSPRRKPY